MSKSIERQSSQMDTEVTNASGLLRLGTRGSALATNQSSWVAQQILVSTGLASELILIKSEGDDLSKDLTKPVQPGVFVNLLREKLLNNEVDYIVHSFKDLPSLAHPLITVAAVPARQDARDALVSKAGLPLQELADGSRIGTSSPRRKASLLANYPEKNFSCELIRGNVDTRIEKVRSGEYDATFLALAGLNRLGLSHEVSEIFTVDTFVPAPAQGALAIEVLTARGDLLHQLRTINDQRVEIEVTAERAILRGLQAGCEIALGAHATIKNGQLSLLGELADPATGASHRIQLTSTEISLVGAETLGRRAATELANSLVGLKVLKR